MAMAVAQSLEPCYVSYSCIRVAAVSYCDGAPELVRPPDGLVRHAMNN
jgi:hypothetical protein